MITVEVPIALPSASNLREHWRERHRRIKSQCAATSMMLGFMRVVERLGGDGAVKAGDRLAVTLTRVAPRKLDSDNLQGAFKGVRDEVAKFFGVDDGDKRHITWSYAQTTGKPSTVLIDLAIQALP